MTDLNRRRFLQTSAATTLAAGVPGLAAAQESLGMAMIVPSPVGDVGWSHSLAIAMEKVQAELGANLTILENIPEGPDADRMMNRLVSDGNKFLLAGSFGYQNGAMQIARRLPLELHALGYQ